MPVEKRNLDMLESIEVPAEIAKKWRGLLDILSETLNIPAALVMRVHKKEIEVFARSDSPGNVYHVGERASLGTGLYCEKVMSSRKLLIVPDATKDPRWDHNPDIPLGMISYMGYPLLWPGGEVFGTICVLDTKENAYSPTQTRLLDHFRETVETDLATIREKSALNREIEEHRRTEAALRASEERFRHLAEATRDVIYRMSLPDGRYEYTSPAVTDLFELTPEEIYKDPARFRDIIHPGWREYFSAEWSKLLLGEVPPFYEYQIVTKSGAIKWLNQRNTLIRDSEGRPVALEGIVTDITERVEREERIKRYLELLSGLIGTREVYAENPLGVLPVITERAAGAIGVERVSVWFYNDDFTEIRCHDLFELSKGTHSSGEMLRSAVFPEYTACHSEGQVVAAEDVFTDPRTAKIPAEYYLASGIVSLLDAPIWVGGKLVALLSFEHTGEQRRWLAEEEHLALTLAAHTAASIEASRRNEAEKALRLSEQRIRALANNLPGVVFQFYAREKGEMGLYYVGDRAAELLGIDNLPADFLDRFTACLPHEDRDRFLSSIADAVRKVSDWEYEGEFVKPTGEKLYVRGMSQPERMPDEIVFNGVLLNITDRRRAEQRLEVRLRYEAGIAACSRELLHDSEDALSAALGHLVKAANTGRVYIFENIDTPDEGLCMRQTHEACAPGVAPQIDNPEFQRLPYDPYFTRWKTALSQGETIVGDVWDFPERERGILESQNIVSILVLPIAVYGGWHGFIGFDNTSDRRKWDENDIRMLNIAAEMIGFHIERNQAEEARRREAARRDELEAIINRSPAVAFLWRAAEDWPVEFVSDNVSIFGYTPDDLVSGRVKYAGIVHPDDLARVAEEVEAYERAGRDEFTQEYRLLTPGGDIRWIEDRTITRRGPDDEVTHFEGVITDITDRRRAEDELRDSEEKYRRLHESMMDGFVRVEKDGRIVEFNSAFREMLGYSAAELLRLTYKDITPEKWHNFEEDIIARQVMTRDYSDAYEKEYHRKDGTIFPVELRTHIIRDQEGHPTGMWAIVRDISLRKQAEEEIRRSERRLLGFIEHSPFGAHMWRLEPEDGLVLVDYNPAADRILRIDHQPLIGKDITDAFPLNKGTPIPAAYRRVIETGEPWRVDQTSYDDGNSIAGVFEVHAFQTAPNEMVALFRDVTELRRAEQALRESEERYRLLVDNVQFPVAVTTLDDGSMLYLNACAEDFLNIPSGQYRDKTSKSFWVDLSQRDRFIAELKQNGRVNGFECMLHSKDGPRWVILSSNIIEFEGNRTAFNIFNDITKRKEVEDALRESEERYRLLVDNVRFPVVVTTVREGVVRYINTRAAEFFGIDAVSAVGENARDYWVEAASRDRFVESLMISGRVSGMESMLKSKEGPRWVMLSSNVIDFSGERAAFTIFSDITERKIAEDALRKSEEHYRLLVDTVPFPVTVTTLGEGRVLYFNSRARDFFDIQQDLGREISSMRGWGDTASRERFVAELKAHGQVRGLEREIQTSLGPRWVILSSNIIEYEGLQAVFTIFNDITERKLAEDAVRESERQLKTLLDSLDVGVMIVDAATHEIVSANRGALELFGAPEEEVIGRECHNFICPAVKGACPITDVGETAETAERVLVNAAGKQVPVLKSVVRTRFGDRDCLVESFVDISERKHLEQQLSQAQKMETIGRLAGGVAHDFNNILTVINANAEVSLMDMDPADPSFEAFTEIKKYGERAADLTRKLLAFSRKQIVEPKVVNLNTVLLDMDKMLRRLIGENIELTTILDDTLKPVFIDPGQIEQVFTNLVVNARDAMPGGGRLTIETRNATLDEEYVKSHADTEPGEYAMFSVTDQGHGMDAETMSHLFEPFFTTKDIGSGTGLGLPTCYGIVKQNHGSIIVYSEPGKGTTFKVFLPVIPQTGEPAPSVKVETSLPGGTETVLLVEDDAGIRSMVTRFLASSGYTVIDAENGEAALSKLHGTTGRVDILVTDVVMPLMGGRELAARLDEMFSGVRVLFMSGYTDNTIVHQGVLEPGIMFIQKPFSMIDFMRKVRETLDGA